MFICGSTTQYNRTYLLPPGFAPVTLVKLPCNFDLKFFHPHHLDLPPGHPRVTFRIEHSSTCDTWAQGQNSNPDPESPQAAGPGDQGTACLCFPGMKPLQAEANNDGPNGEVSQTKGIIAPNEGVIKAPNGGNKTLNHYLHELEVYSGSHPRAIPERRHWPTCQDTTSQGKAC
ncbi:hypothetical protein DSO57_1007978 [Entomophthora muscae]|uniref:Uncharacterized protein n=1 Tax=Entomophthora muscae TaxID=34485 RepID=A0ACC2THX7_9FUNG|nr:hypothetical protein DSO57_1007978 [Entomophthora muscae]